MVRGTSSSATAASAPCGTSETASAAPAPAAPGGFSAQCCRHSRVGSASCGDAMAPLLQAVPAHQDEARRGSRCPPPPPAPASTQSWPSASHGGLPPALCQSAADTSCASRRLRPGTARNPHEPGEPRRVSAAAATAVVVAVCMFACMSACCVCLCVCVRAEGALNVAGGVEGTWEMSSGRTDGSASLVQTIALRYRLRTSFRQMKSLSASARDTLDIVAIAAAAAAARRAARRRHVWAVCKRPKASVAAAKLRTAGAGWWPRTSAGRTCGGRRRARRAFRRRRDCFLFAV